MKEDNKELMERLEKLESRIANLENKKDRQKEEVFEEKPMIREEEINSNVDRLAKDAGTSLEKIKAVLYFDTTGVIPTVTLKGENEAEKQVSASLMILTGNAYLLGKEEIESIELRQKLEKLGIRSLINLSTNLGEYPTYVIREGKQGSKNYKYKLTIPGKKRGLEILKEYAEATK